MVWQDIRQHYPQQWMLVEAIQVRSTANKRILEQLAVIDTFPDSIAALQRKKIMLPTMSIEEVQATLPEIISKLGPGEEVLITQDDQPVAKLISQPKAARQSRRPGSAKGIRTIVSEDEEHLEDFKEYIS